MEKGHASGKDFGGWERADGGEGGGEEWCKLLNAPAYRYAVHSKFTSDALDILVSKYCIKIKTVLVETRPSN